MHTSDYITSLFRSFPSLPMAGPIKVNVLYLTLRDGQDFVPCHLLIAMVLQTSADLWTDPVTCHPWSLPLPQPSSLTQLPGGLLGCERQCPMKGWDFREEDVSGTSRSGEEGPDDRGKRPRERQFWRQMVTLGMESEWERRTEIEPSISGWEAATW